MSRAQLCALCLLAVLLCGVWPIYGVYVQGDRALTPCLLLWLVGSLLALHLLRAYVTIGTERALQPTAADWRLVRIGCLASGAAGWIAQYLYGGLGTLVAVGLGLGVTFALAWRQVAARGKRL